MAVPTKVDRMVTYLEDFPLIKLYNPLNTWYITWQTKAIYFHDQIVFGNLTRQDGDLSLVGPSYKVT